MKMICSEYKRFKKICDERNCGGSIPKEYYIKDFLLYKICQMPTNSDEYNSLILDRVWFDESLDRIWFDESVGWPKTLRIHCKLIPVPITYYMEKILDGKDNR